MKDVLIAYADFVMIFYLLHNFTMAITIEAWIPHISVRTTMLCLMHNLFITFAVYFVPVMLIGKQENLLVLQLFGTLIAVIGQLPWLLVQEIVGSIKRIIILFVLPIAMSIIAYYSHVLLQAYSHLPSTNIS